MGTIRVGIFFRFSVVLFLFCFINLLFVDVGEPEYYILVISLAVNAVFILLSAAYLLKNKDKGGM